PKGRRGSYRQWEEQNIAPQVVFEVLSPGNRAKEMQRKLEFYTFYGVEEYYIIDPDRKRLRGYLRNGNRLEQTFQMNGWTSPRLGIKFEIKQGEIQLYQPDGTAFRDYLEIAKDLETQQLLTWKERARAEQEKMRAEQEKMRAEQEKMRAEQEKMRAEQEKIRAEIIEKEKQEALQKATRLAERLRAMGIDPNSI
ncbi:MAG: hypothetical protein FD167_5139, partial [bacterium]